MNDPLNHRTGDNDTGQLVDIERVVANGRDLVFLSENPDSVGDDKIDAHGPGTGGDCGPSVNVDPVGRVKDIIDSGDWNTGHDRDLLCSA